VIPVAWSSLIEALVRVESAEPHDAGLLSFGSDPDDGGIFVENQRICWAAARGMQGRLTDLLRATAVSPIDFDELYRRCRTEGRLLGQTLVEEGLVTTQQLEHALRRHSAESLVALCRGAGRLTMWTSRGGRGYAAQFTFRPLDVLFDAIALQAPDLQAVALGHLEAMSGQGRRGGAFAFDLEHAHAVPVAACGEPTVHELWILGRWALALPQAARELAATPAFVIAATPAGDTIVVWWRDQLLYAVMCEDRRSVAAITALHLQGEQS